ncbi:class I SAM-dependent methyltransferase [Acinetobacter puyangensis]|uniref:Methyltransferase domain-containing protein n=1 Tax=Acinetobacter puyangensis TaxID=1096779 RepID=A0A240E8V2_9GAMM|nr:class I SAM-dependent methyltransferase [Acinetobacter puyangensis]SNX44649.1 Methyltransferase domain-containing protein [Acinetobacter puyangensis]
MKTQHDISKNQYSDKSQHYLESSVHAQGIEFQKIVEEISGFAESKIDVLDLGCGGGHVSYQLAPYVNTIVAYDLSSEMLDTVKQTARDRNLSNISLQQGTAEHLPFADHHFDLVVSRYSAHHWQHVGQALQEVHRVLKPNGKLILIDILGSDIPMFDTFLQSIEFIRDPSHVRDYSLSEWTNLCEYTNFDIARIEQQKLALDFQAWVRRMDTAPEQIQTLHFLQQHVADNVKQYFAIQPDGSFSSHVVYLVATRLS